MKRLLAELQSAGRTGDDPGPQPPPCPDITLACYLKPSSVGKGLGGGKPLSQSQTTVTLGNQVREERSGEEIRGQVRRGDVRRGDVRRGEVRRREQRR